MVIGDGDPAEGQGFSIQNAPADPGIAMSQSQT